MTLIAPKFTLENIEPDLVGDGLGDAFQRFLGELFGPKTEVERFQTRGRDGAIDLSETVDGVRTVYEGKASEDAKFERAERAWREGITKLRKYLEPPDAPPKGSGQYKPWYRRDPAIGHYRFCINAECNQNQADGLRDIIQEDLDRLIDKHGHLKHLRGLTAAVWHWERLADLLNQQPDLLFRWFPGTRTRTLRPLEQREAGAKKTIRSYLNPNVMPHYALEIHLKGNPAPAGVLGEEALLDRLDQNQIPGVLAIGSGGIGKTRLIFELGWRAKKRDWVVRQVVSRDFDSADLERVVAQTPADTPILLVIDYLETLSGFHRLEEIISEYDRAVYFVASCRKSFFQSLSLLSDPHVVDLDGRLGSAEETWRQGYRAESTRHILREKAVPELEACAEQCRAAPILAVFFVYLHETGRGDDLRRLLEELQEHGHFGNWLRRRVEASFVGDKETRQHHLPLLMGQFPMPEQVADGLGQPFSALFRVLAEDGWVEHIEADNANEAQWVAGHDILADGVLVDHLMSFSATRTLFVSQFLETAQSLGTQHSALVALNRLAGEPALAGVDWPSAFSRRIVDAPEAWYAVRGPLFRGPLLSAEDKLVLLEQEAEFWAGAEQETAFQIGLAGVARAVAKPDFPDRQQAKDVLKPWLDKARAKLGSRNDVLTAGLRLFPTEFEQAAVECLEYFPRAFQTHYLLVAWLETGLPPDAVRDVVTAWLSRFARDPHLSFVVQRWLDATKDGALVNEPIGEWLDVPENRLSPEANFVYTAWLDATQDRDLVEEPIRQWLEVAENRLSLDARFVYTAWLDATKDRTLVEDPIRRWLEVAANRVSPEASFVYTAWLDATKDRALVEDPIRRWLEVAENRVSLDAQFVYKAWLDATKDRTLVEQPIRLWLKVAENCLSLDAQFVYKAWLDATKDRTLVEQPIRRWLEIEANRLSPEANFVYTAWLDATKDRTLVEEAIRQWLEVAENRLSQDANFVYRAWLDATKDRTLVKEPIRQWLSVDSNRTADDADFLFRAWLEAGGELETVLEGLLDWLHDHRDRYEAVYVTKILADQWELPRQAVEDILHWCEIFAEDEDACWRMSRLRRNLQQPEIAKTTLRTFEAVFRARVAGSHPLPLADRRNLSSILTNLLYLSQDVETLRETVDGYFVEWLRYPDSFNNVPPGPLVVQRMSKVMVRRVADLLKAGTLDVDRDREPLMKFLRWVDLWEPECKEELRVLFGSLRTDFPTEGLWEIVRFD